MTDDAVLLGIGVLPYGVMVVLYYLVTAVAGYLVAFGIVLMHDEVGGMAVFHQGFGEFPEGSGHASSAVLGGKSVVA